MKETLDTVEEAVNGLDKKLDAVEEHNRKMRFAADNADGAPGIWIKRGQTREYGLEELALGRMILNARGAVLPDEMESKFQSLADKAQKYTLTTEDAGAGAELVPVGTWSALFEDTHAATQVMNLFRPFVQMTSKTEELPEMGDALFYKPAGEGQAVTATDPVTAKRTLTAFTLKSQVDVSDEESDDAIVHMLSTIRQTLIRNGAETIDELILNGDSTGGTANINDYGATIPTDSRFLVGFNGLIYYCLNELTGTPQKSSLTTLEVADFATLISMLGKYGDNPDRCAFLIDRGTKNKAILLSDFTTKDKMGEKATLLTGQIGQVFGVPVVMSAGILKSDANGRVDGATPGNNTLGRIVLVNRDMWKVGMRKVVTVRTERSEAKGVTSLVCTMRIGLQCFGDRSDAKYSHTALGYNITV